MYQTSCWHFIGLLSQHHSALREIRCSSFGSRLYLPRCCSRCVWFTDHCRRACLSIHPSICPSRPWAALPPSPSVRVRLPLPFGRQQPPGSAQVCVWGGSPVFQTKELASGVGRGGGRVCPSPWSSERLRPSPMGASSQEPSASPSMTGGFSGRAFSWRQICGLCHAGSVRLLLHNLFPYLYVQGMGLMASSKTTSVYSVN